MLYTMGWTPLLPCCLVVTPPGAQAITGWQRERMVASTAAAFSQAPIWQVRPEQNGDHDDMHWREPTKHATQHNSIVYASHAVNLGMATCCHVCLVSCPCCVLECNSKLEQVNCLTKMRILQGPRVLR